MRVVIIVNTPGQFHFFRNIYEQLTKRGNKVSFVIRTTWKETADLARELHFENFMYDSNVELRAGKVIGLPFVVHTLTRYCMGFNPDIIVGFGVYDAFVSGLIGRTCIEFNDSEFFVNPMFYPLQYRAYRRFVSSIITPSCFRQDLGSKQIRVESYKELAYLHPNYYIPNEEIFDCLGVKKNEDYVILRFNSFDAVHDIGIKGFTTENKEELVRSLSKSTRVFISSERKLTKSIEDYALPIPKNRIHDALFFSKLLVTDTQTMATEAAVLGTPVVRCNEFVGFSDMGNFLELEKRFGLIYNISNHREAIEKANELVNMPNLKKEWKEKRVRMLQQKVDITQLMAWFIENYPRSLEMMKENPRTQYQFN